MKDKEVSLNWWLEFIIHNSPEEKLRNLAYRCLTRLRVLQTNKADEKYAELLERQLVEMTTELSEAYGMASTKSVTERVAEALGMAGL